MACPKGSILKLKYTLFIKVRIVFIKFFTILIVLQYCISTINY